MKTLNYLYSQSFSFFLFWNLLFLFPFPFFLLFFFFGWGDWPVKREEFRASTKRQELYIIRGLLLLLLSPRWLESGKHEIVIRRWERHTEYHRTDLFPLLRDGELPRAMRTEHDSATTCYVNVCLIGCSFAIGSINISKFIPRLISVLVWQTGTDQISWSKNWCTDPPP